MTQKWWWDWVVFPGRKLSHASRLQSDKGLSQLWTRMYHPWQKCSLLQLCDIYIHCTKLCNRTSCYQICSNKTWTPQLGNSCAIQSMIVVWMKWKQSSPNILISCGEYDKIWQYQFHGHMKKTATFWIIFSSSSSLPLTLRWPRSSSNFLCSLWLTDLLPFLFQDRY